MANRNSFYLIRALEPLAKLTFILGILPDWCGVIPKRKTIMRANLFAVFLNVCLLVIMVAYMFYQGYCAINESNSVHVSIPLLVWMFCCTVMTCTIIYLIFQHKEMIRFFSDWTSMEKTLPFIDQKSRKYEEKLKNRLYVMLIIYVVLTLVSIMTLPYVSMQRTSYLYQMELRQLFTDSALLVTQSLSCTCVLVINFMGEMVPALIHVHAAIIIRALEKQIKQGFGICFGYGSKKADLLGKSLLEERLLHTLTRYEEICQFIIRVNLLFGLPMFASHSSMLAYVILQTFSLLKNLSNINWLEFLVIFSNIPFLVFRVMVTVSTSNIFSTALPQFKSTLNKILIQHRAVLKNREYYFLKNFMLRLSANNVFVSPLSLYRTNRSLLLNMFSIFVTYNVIFIQS